MADIPDMQAMRKRANAEKKRREKLKKEFKALQKVLPKFEHNEQPATRRKILAEMVNYVQTQRVEQAKRESELEKLKEEREKLLKQVEELERLRKIRDEQRENFPQK